jgi:hypothetical protein
MVNDEKPVKSFADELIEKLKRGVHITPTPREINIEEQVYEPKVYIDHTEGGGDYG